MIGDWDRHRDQWRWAKFAGQAALAADPRRPRPGLLALRRPGAGPRAPPRAVLPELPRRLPEHEGPHLERPRAGPPAAGRPRAAGVQGRRRRAAVADHRRGDRQGACGACPPEFVELDAARLAKDLKGRRDRLAAAAEAYYEHLAEKVRGPPERCRGARRDRAATAATRIVRAWARGRTGAGRRARLRQDAPREGDGRSAGLPGRRQRPCPDVGQGERHPGSRDRDGGAVRRGRHAGRRHALQQRRRAAGSSWPVQARTSTGGKYEPPPPPEDTPWIRPRGWGRDTLLLAVARVRQRPRPLRRRGGGHEGPSASARTRTRAVTSLRAGWAFGEQSFRADYRAEFRVENRGWYWGWYGYASGVDASRYFGFGNETSDGGDPNNDFYKTKQNAVRLHAHAGAAARERPHASSSVRRFATAPTGTQTPAPCSTWSSPTAPATSEKSGRRGSLHSTRATARSTRAAWRSATSATRATARTWPCGARCSRRPGTSRRPSAR